MDTTMEVPLQNGNVGKNSYCTLENMYTVKGKMEMFWKMWSPVIQNIPPINVSYR